MNRHTVPNSPYVPSATRAAFARLDRAMRPHGDHRDLWGQPLTLPPAIRPLPAPPPLRRDTASISRRRGALAALAGLWARRAA